MNNLKHEQVKQQLRNAKTENELDYIIRNNPVLFTEGNYLYDYAYFRRYQIIKSEVQNKK